MSDDASEKKHQASGKKIADLKRRGQTMRSRDLTSGLVFMSAVMMLISISGEIAIQFQHNFIYLIHSIRLVAEHADLSHLFIGNLILKNMLIVLPVFGVVIIMALLSPVALGGWNFTFEPMQFKLESLNPISNLKKMFSSDTLMNVMKSLIKVGIIGIVSYLFIINNFATFTHLIAMPVGTAALTVGALLTRFITYLSASLVIIIGVDVASNYHSFQKKVMMTSQELKDEHKESEGSGEAKRKIRSAQLAMVKQRISAVVPRANVIITNPTHYAVAIKYDDHTDKAPRVVAKGKDYVAQQIKRIGMKHAVPIYEAPELARAVYHTCKLGKEVHPALYMSIAIVLSYIYQLRRYQQGVGQLPTYISDLKIPAEFIFEK